MESSKVVVEKDQKIPTPPLVTADLSENIGYSQAAASQNDMQGKSTQLKNDEMKKMTPSAAEVRAKIIDIRRDKKEHSLVNDIFSGLRPSNGGEKRLPTLLLYDEKGLKLFEKITYLEEYYLTNAEIEVLERYADAIAQYLQPGSIVLELGSGYEFHSCY